MPLTLQLKCTSSQRPSPCNVITACATSWNELPCRFPITWLRASNGARPTSYSPFSTSPVDSAGEIRSMFRVMERWNAFANFKSQISDLRTRSERISKQLYGWIESLKNSDITGQRHLDDRRRASDATKKDREEFLAELHRITEVAAEERRKYPK